MNILTKQTLIELIILFLRMIYSFLKTITKVKRNRILFLAYRGRDYTCNPKYVTEYILNNSLDKELEIYWVCKNKKSSEYLKKKGIKVIYTINSLYFIKILLTSSVIVDNLIPVRYYSKRQGQRYIETWHGGGCYKKSGKDFEQQNFLTKYSIIQTVKSITDFLSSSSFFTDEVIKKSFNYEGNIINSGLPRNDILINSVNKNNNFFNYYKLDPSFYYILYAPTFREEKNNLNFDFDVSKLLISCKLRFGGQWKLLIRSHDSENLCRINNAIDITFYPDMQEILQSIDILISDYSSSIWDFSFTNKPCFLYCYDLNEFNRIRGFYKPVEEWGFPVAVTFEKLCINIEHFDNEKYNSDIKNMHQNLGSYEKGKACKEVFSLIKKYV